MKRFDVPIPGSLVRKHQNWEMDPGYMVRVLLAIALAQDPAF